MSALLEIMYGTEHQSVMALGSHNKGEILPEMLQLWTSSII
jgi:hypothetical protein